MALEKEPGERLGRGCGIAALGGTILYLLVPLIGVAAVAIRELVT